MSAADGSLYLDLELHQAHFSDAGRYFLRFSVQGSPEIQSDVKLYVNKSKTPVNQSQHTTDPCLQSVPEQPLHFSDSLLTFYLPQGFSEQDIFLAIESYKKPDIPLKEEEKCGENVFLVYPRRSSQPLSSIESETRSNNLYKIEKQFALKTESELNGVSVNVGSVLLGIVLRKATDEDMETEPEIHPLASERPQFPAPSSTTKPSSVPSTPSPVPGSGIITIAESPLGPLNSSVHPRHLCGSYVAREGFCEVAILVHAAVGLPNKSDGRPPQPFVTGKSKKDRNRGLQAQYVTHTSLQPTHYPTWDETLLVEFPKDEAKQEEMFLYVADYPSKELLVEYRIPVSQLKPFYQYNLELVKPNRDQDSSARLYVSLILKYDKLIKPENSSANIFGMEMMLRGLECPISNQTGALIAVSRIVIDWDDHRENVLKAHPCTAGVTITTITFPSPHPTSFSVAGASLSSGSPQVTVCGEPIDRPQWNQMFLFAGDVESLFCSQAALVVEFYPASLAFSDAGWVLSNPIGYCHQLLNQSLASALQQQNAKLGLRLNGLPIQGALKTPSGRTATAAIVLRLLSDELPEALGSVSQFSSLPCFNETPEPITGDRFAAKPMTTSGKNPYGLPPFDAVQRLLPFNDPQSAVEPSERLMPPLQQVGTNRGYGGNDVRAVPPELRNTMDLRTLALLDYQMKEVDRYRTAMRKLAADLLHLKQENLRLEEANSRHRRDLSQHDEISRLMIGSNDLDNVTHSELVQKFVLLKKKLSDESTKRQELQKRTQKLQNDLIKKNEKEKDLFKLREAHESQQALLQKMQSKIQKYKALQDTCKKQEKVIVELEKLLSNGDKNVLSLSGNRGSSSVFLEENARLQLELEQYKELAKSTQAQREPLRKTSPSLETNSEKLELYEKLERSEGRILGLEEQLAQNARTWAKEKTQMQIKLNEVLMEQQTGFPNFFTTEHAQYTPDINVRHSSGNMFLAGSRRPSPKLDPLGQKRR